jgi:hypothetical protein
MGVVKKHLNSAPLVNALSDFHLLLFLMEAHILEPHDFQLIADIARYHRDADADTLVRSGGWQTLLMITEEADVPMAGGGSFGGGSSSSSSAQRNTVREPWQCRHCTFVNISGDNCEVCGLPADG